MENTYIKVDEFLVCEDCGAFGFQAPEMIHHISCHPGEYEYWENHYNAAWGEEMKQQLEAGGRLESWHSSPKPTAGNQSARIEAPNKPTEAGRRRLISQPGKKEVRHAYA